LKVRTDILLILAVWVSTTSIFANQTSRSDIERRTLIDSARAVEIAKLMAQQAGVQIDPNNPSQAILPFIGPAAQQVQQERQEKNNAGGGGGGGSGSGGNDEPSGFQQMAAGVAAMIQASQAAVMAAINASRDKDIAKTEAGTDKYIAKKQAEATMFGAALGAADAIDKSRASVDINKMNQDGATQRTWLQTAAMLAIQRVKAQQEASKEAQNFSLKMAAIDMQRMQNRALDAQANMITRGRLMIAALGNPMGLTGNYMNRGGIVVTNTSTGLLSNAMVNRGGFLTNSLSTVSERTRLNRRLNNYNASPQLTSVASNTAPTATGNYTRGSLSSLRGGNKYPMHSSQTLRTGRHGSSH
jgi:hypothetical protein